MLHAFSMLHVLLEMSVFSVREGSRIIFPCCSISLSLKNLSFFESGSLKSEEYFFLSCAICTCVFFVELL